MKKPKCRGCGHEVTFKFFRGYWYCKNCYPLAKKGALKPVDILI